MEIKLKTVNLEVADPHTSKRFFLDALGMTENVKRSHEPDFVYLESAGADITLAKSRGTSDREPPCTIELGFEVEDLGALRKRFAEKGVTGFEPQTMGWGEVIEGQDPDGHRVIVYCFK